MFYDHLKRRRYHEPIVTTKRALRSWNTGKEAGHGRSNRVFLRHPAFASRQHGESIKKFLVIVLHPKDRKWPAPLPDLGNLPDAFVDEIVKKTISFSANSLLSN